MFEESPVYMSCIKIKGQPIIAPLMTPQRREECLQDKRKAVEIEHRRERCNLHLKCMDDLARLGEQTQSLFVSPKTTLESQLTFHEHELFERVSPERLSKNRIINLTSETVDVTEYKNSGVRIISKNEKTPTPKLIRSNSYILESPSPILLAHLEKEAQKCVSGEFDNQEKISISPITVIESTENSPKTKNIIETSVMVEEVSVSSPLTCEEFLKSQTVDPRLLNILQTLPGDCAKNIMEILERQQQEQTTKYHDYLQLKNKLLGSVSNGVIITDDKPTSVSISSTQSLYYSIGSDTLTPDSTFTENYVKNCNKNLFFNSSDGKKEWAAGVIGAAARGYLVRRLFRTEKVQGLLETLKDALLCALQLERAETIDESDIELHRRLIQQVSAACDAFHDIFFSVSVKEQMLIIANDRQTKIERSKRPASVRSRGSLIGTPM